MELSELLLGRFAVPRQKPLSFARDCPHRLMQLKGYSGPAVEWDWHRGFVSTLRVTADLFVAHGRDTLARHPVADVRLETFSVKIVPPTGGAGWRIRYSDPHTPDVPMCPHSSYGTRAEMIDVLMVDVRHLRAEFA
jgi:hypothetical protein